MLLITLGDVKTIAGGTKGFLDGKKLQAKFYFPSQLVIDGLGQYVYIADHVSICVGRVDIPVFYLVDTL